MAVEFFEAVWNRRNNCEEGSDERITTHAAGVALAAHLELSDYLRDRVTADLTTDEVLTTVEQHTDELGLAPKSVFEYLHKGRTDTTPEQLKSSARRTAKQLGQDGELLLGVVFTSAFANLLYALGK